MAPKSSSKAAASPAKSTPAPAKAVAAKPVAAKPAPTPAPAPAKAAAKPSKLTVTAEERWRMVAEAAYFIAEKRGFQSGDPAQDWVQAEQQIAAILGKG